MDNCKCGSCIDERAMQAVLQHIHEQGFSSDADHDEMMRCHIGIITSMQNKISAIMEILKEVPNKSVTGSITGCSNPFKPCLFKQGIRYQYVTEDNTRCKENLYICTSGEPCGGAKQRIITIQ